MTAAMCRHQGPLVLEEIQQAFAEIRRDQRAALIWNPIFSEFTPCCVEQCERAIERSTAFLQDAQGENMFSDLTPVERKRRAAFVVSKLADLTANRGHNRPCHIQVCRDMSLHVVALGDDPELQDSVLTVHHCYMHSRGNTPAIKIIENHEGEAIIKPVQMATVHSPRTTSIAPSGPS